MKRVLLLSLLVLAGCQTMKMPCSGCTRIEPARPVDVAEAESSPPALR